MRRILFIVLFALVFLAGLSILLYPVVSDSINSRKQEQSVSLYFAAIENLSQQDFTELFEAANLYNEGLRNKPNRFIMDEEENAEYRSLLNPLGTGALATLEIEIIDIHLTIYHGTDEGVLQVGLGHFEGSSLPVGGPGTHTVITGHRGLPSSTLLTNLDRLVIGDTFHINVLGERLAYTIDQIKIVLPHETEELVIVPGYDYATLVTCTPYGINTHRMLVRGFRADNDEAGTHTRAVVISSGARVITGPVAALLFFIPALIVVTVMLFLTLRRIYRRGN